MPPPIGSRVAITIQDQPPPPTGDSTPLPQAPMVDRVLTDRYKPPEWLSAERKLEDDGKLTAKGIVLGIGAIVALFVATVIILMIMMGGGDEGLDADTGQDPVSFSMTGANASI
ncbi:MAG: hypothetical protein ACR2P0_04325 [Acidimicrobiales bacterium]